MKWIVCIKIRHPLSFSLNYLHSLHNIIIDALSGCSKDNSFCNRTQLIVLVSGACEFQCNVAGGEVTISILLLLKRDGDQIARVEKVLVMAMNDEYSVKLFP